jgi:hypothetical protein
MAVRSSSPNKSAPKAKRSRRPPTKHELGDDSDLSPAQVRELEKRIKDLDDRTRYLLVSILGPSFVLYYNVSEDTYGWNEPAHATLFKRRKAAQAIAQLLGDKDSVVQCSVNKRGELVKKTLSLPRAARKRPQPPRKPTRSK